MIFLNFLAFFVEAIDTPIVQTRDVLVLIVLRLTSLLGSSCLIVTRFLEALFLHSILHIKAIGTTSLISDEKFSIPIIKTDASDVSLGDVMEHILETAIRGIPDFNTGRVSSDKSVEDGVVENAQTGVLVCQVVINRLIVVIEDQAAASNDNPFRGLRDSQSMNLIQAAVESLGCRVGAHVPHSNHARDIRTDDLLSASNPLHTDQTVVVALHDEDFRLDLWVPHVDVVVETGTEDHIHVCIPVQRMHSKLMSLRKFVLKCEVIHFPKRDDSVHTARGQIAH